MTEPACTWNAAVFREQATFVGLLATLWVLSLIKLAQPRLEGAGASALNTLSRPVILVVFLAWIAMRMWRG